LSELDIPTDPRLVTGSGDNEDAAVVTLPPGKALVQTIDFFTPIVNDPRRFGEIAAANALSDVYAMGAEPWTAMNVVCFPVKTLPKCLLVEILRGGLAKVLEAGAVMAGGHSVEDQEIKFGLSVTGLVDLDRVATNRGLVPGDRLILTKPLGLGVLATALKGGLGDAEAIEEAIWKTASRLNRSGGAVIRELGLKAATDVTGFGLGGHVLEMSRASGWTVAIEAASAPVIPQSLELARQGFFPAGSRANRRHFENLTLVSPGVDQLLADLIFDAQTSGGLVLAVPEIKVEAAREMLLAAGDLAQVVGLVLDEPASQGKLLLR
jgi:selenide, water dikinase